MTEPISLPSRPIHASLSATSKRQRLRADLASGPAILAPGVYDGLSARVADAVGARALYLTGYGVSASVLARPDAGYLDLTIMADRVRRLCEGTDAPLIADADTGFGGVMQVMDTMRTLEAAGASAIQIEDQVSPKRCGHTLGREVGETKDMLVRIRAALESRQDPATLLIARTDARTTLGLDEAIRRGERYATAGADIIFVESPESAEEFEAIARRLKGVVLLANMVPGGRSPTLSRAELDAMGYRLVIHPGAALGPVVAALKAALLQVCTDGQVALGAVPSVSPTELHALVGFAEVWETDRRLADRQEGPQ